MDHLHVYTANPINGTKTEFTLWDTPNGEEAHVEWVGRCSLIIETGNATVHTAPTAGECRQLAAHLLAMADALDADTTVFQPKED